MYMPGGTHTITPSQAGRAVTVTVSVDAASADELEAQRKIMVSAGNKPFFSIGPESHKSDQAAFWPTEFFWAKRLDATGKMVEGVWARGTWSASGRAAVEGKDFRVFSPTFFVSEVKNDPRNPVTIVCCDDAKANMGALVNDPAFKKISPLWCGNAGAPGGNQNNKTRTQVKKNTETIAQLQARKETLETTMNGLDGRVDAASRNELRNCELECSEIDAQIELKETQAKLEASNSRDLNRIRIDAENAVQHMVDTGAIAPRDRKLRDEWLQKFTDDPSLIRLQCGNAVASQAITGVSRQVTPHSAALDAGGERQGQYTRRISEDPKQTLRTMAQICAQNTKSGDLKTKIDCSNRFGIMYKNEIAPLLAKDSGAFQLDAADYAGGDGLASNTIGTLSGTLVAQRTLDLYKFEFPMLSSIATDFSDEPASFGQTTQTRIIVIPAVLSYNPAADATGRPTGYVIATQAQTVDAPITLNKHRAVPIVFDANTLASTTRRLFEEQAPAAAYALGLDVVNALYANITAANFAANAPFQVNPTSYGRPTFSKAKRILNLQGAPFTNRFALSSSIYQEQLEQDPTLVSLAVFQKPEIITMSQLPNIARFTPYEAQNLPATVINGASTLQAFFAHKTALLMQARIPNDWNKALGEGNGYGSVNVVTNPDTGLSVLLVQYSNPTAAYAEYRLALIYGTAPGNTKGGVIVTN